GARHTAGSGTVRRCGPFSLEHDRAGKAHHLRGEGQRVAGAAVRVRRFVHGELHALDLVRAGRLRIRQHLAKPTLLLGTQRATTLTVRLRARSRFPTERREDIRGPVALDGDPGNRQTRAIEWKRYRTDRGRVVGIGSVLIEYE